MKKHEILEKLTHVDSEYYELCRARTLMDSPEFYLELVLDIQKIIIKESDNLLEKYMAEVIDAEGVSFVPYKAGYRRGGAPIFTQEELDKLDEIEKKLISNE